MEIYLALIAASAILVLIPGPNVALIVATSLVRGPRFGLLAVAGTTLGIAIQLVLTVFGLSGLLEMAAISLEWLRWLGVCYLTYLGVHLWMTPASDLAEAKPELISGQKIFWGGAGVAVVNPKTLLFHAAFLPQFVVDESGVSLGVQFMLIAGLYLSVVALGDCLWACLAGRARVSLSRFGRLRYRLAGCFFFGSAVALALSRR